MNRILIFIILYFTFFYRTKMESPVYFVDRVVGGFNGICLPPFGIYINKIHKKNNTLLNHEKVHWVQYQRLGLVFYYLNYLVSYLIYGYDDHPFEKEARFEESDFAKDNYTLAVRSGLAVTAYNPEFRKN